MKPIIMESANASSTALRRRYVFLISEASGCRFLSPSFTLPLSLSVVTRPNKTVFFFSFVFHFWPDFPCLCKVEFGLAALGLMEGCV